MNMDIRTLLKNKQAQEQAQAMRKTMLLDQIHANLLSKGLMDLDELTEEKIKEVNEDVTKKMQVIAGAFGAK